ncbi:type II toxin-antitoxin system RelB/DinJ family antitoxin [Guyparkeria halophila]|uniref:Type II toxin-antitoxin system RelB/DinJ family antitoxin n=1 Tax=Guyparkeria halophila TaxID=47960 RepID=A0A6I6D1Y7_9GAMM|nr:type II toxin-antitoxin system RelB/DinJ family antitoxin [Guyparkeria halophila]QGT78157.1 type II toxin-antitoxin system RelB/DinJ family antitoxin [Guyparkeria halophila]
MNTDAYVRARIDGETKKRAVAALDDMGLSVSDAIRMLMQYIADEKQLPFAVKTPNNRTIRAMNELEEGRGARFDDVETMFQDLES